MALRRCFIGLALATIFPIGIWLLGPLPQATAETLNFKTFNHVTKAEMVPIADVDGHVVSVVLREGVVVFENGEWAWVKGTNIRDLIKGAGTGDSYRTYTFLDGSTVTARSKGTIEATPVGVTSGSKWTGDIFTSQQGEPVDGTTGPPLGGIGAGAVKFCANNGSFSFTDYTPAGMAEDYRPLPGAQFQFYSDRGGVKNTSDRLIAYSPGTRYDDDAIFPIHKVNFGVRNDLEVRMIAFSPWDLSDVPKLSHPYALYEFSVKNLQDSPVDVAIAFQLDYDATPIFVPGKGLKDNISSHEKAVYVKSSSTDAELSVGSDDGFFSYGSSNNVIAGQRNRVAVKLTLEAFKAESIKFVLAWYRKDNVGRFNYEKYFSEVGSAADEGLNNFDPLRDNSVGFVERMRGSNVPRWFTDHLLNLLANLPNNGVYTRDGRYCHAEGEFNILGTNDEMWQARQINTMLVPELVWQELEYWARTQKQDTVGQIHHDFGASGVGVWDMCGWDEWDHIDYRDIDRWVDLNFGFIISVYEAFIATDDHDKLNYLWPYVKKAARRIVDQKELYGDPVYPWAFELSQNMYDAGGYCQAYSSGGAIVAYKVMMTLADVQGEPDTKAIYEEAFNNGRRDFALKWLGGRYEPYLDKHAENALAGPWIANFLKMEQFWPESDLDGIFNLLVNYYDPINNGMGLAAGGYDEWPQHITAHLGGYALQIGRTDVWYAVE